MMPWAHGTVTVAAWLASSWLGGLAAASGLRVEQPPSQAHWQARGDSEILTSSESEPLAWRELAGKHH
jgi:hypothetical protein